MKKIYKHSLLTCVMFFCTAILFGATRSANGTGDSLENAKYAARIELASQILSTVSSQQRSMSMDYVGKTKSSNELFYEDSQIKVDVELFGVQFTNEISNTDKTVTITAYLDEQNSVPLYLEKLNSIKQDIETIEARNETDISNDARKLNLILLMEYYNKFDEYKNVVLSLSYNAKIPILNKSKAGAELDYNNLLIYEVNELQSEYDKLRVNDSLIVSNEALQKQAEMEMLETSIKIKARQEELNKLYETNTLHQKEILDKASVDTKNLILLMSNKANKVKSLDLNGTENPMDLVLQIETKKQLAANLEDALKLEIEKQSSPIEKRYLEEINNIKATKYRAGELSNGIPTTTALKKRENEILTLNEQKNKDLDEIKNQLTIATQKERDKVIESIKSDYSIIVL